MVLELRSQKRENGLLPGVSDGTVVTVTFMTEDLLARPGWRPRRAKALAVLAQR